MKRFLDGWQIGRWSAFNVNSGGYDLYDPNDYIVGWFPTVKACRLYVIENDWRY